MFLSTKLFCEKKSFLWNRSLLNLPRIFVSTYSLITILILKSSLFQLMTFIMPLIYIR